METRRCFLAIPLPEETREKLAALQVRLQEIIKRNGQAQNPVKWVETENFHLTLKFLGDVTGEQLQLINERLATEVMGLAGFPIALEGFGAFPNLNRPGSFWVGIGDIGGRLELLWAKVQIAAEASDFTGDAKKFVPHLTLGRVRRTSAGLVRLEPALIPEGLFNIGSVDVKEINLYESKLLPAGPVYKILKKFPLNSC